MFIIDIDGANRVTGYYAPSLPREFEQYRGNPFKKYLDRSVFYDEYHIETFKRYYRRYRILSDGTLSREIGSLTDLSQFEYRENLIDAMFYFHRILHYTSARHRL
jgi:hypothetical protein